MVKKYYYILILFFFLQSCLASQKEKRLDYDNNIEKFMELEVDLKNNGIVHLGDTLLIHISFKNVSDSIVCFYPKAYIYIKSFSEKHKLDNHKYPYVICDYLALGRMSDILDSKVYMKKSEKHEITCPIIIDEKYFNLGLNMLECVYIFSQKDLVDQYPIVLGTLYSNTFMLHVEK